MLQEVLEFLRQVGDQLFPCALLVLQHPLLLSVHQLRESLALGDVAEDLLHGIAVHKRFHVPDTHQAEGLDLARQRLVLAHPAHVVLDVAEAHLALAGAVPPRPALVHRQPHQHGHLPQLARLDQRPAQLRPAHGAVLPLGNQGAELLRRALDRLHRLALAGGPLEHLLHQEVDHALRPGTLAPLLAPGAVQGAVAQVAERPEEGGVQPHALLEVGGRQVRAHPLRAALQEGRHVRHVQQRGLENPHRWWWRLGHHGWKRKYNGPKPEADDDVEGV
mmetsp:Transcript_49140/g.71770  ORF Transcript_49140/g.71770 Transcript_49140/m.71770 type:complete len:276 (+) Transcript_49140:512-1339(+)